MAAFTFYSNGNLVPHTAGSGLGFFGAGGFGNSIRVGEWNGRTFICSSDGSTQGPEGCNVAWVNSGSGILGQTGSGVGLKNVPNSLATLEIRFTHTSAVRCENTKVYIYDRASQNNAPSGLTCKGFETIHPSALQTVVGSGDGEWTTLAGSGSTLSLCNSPGVSGFYAGNGSNSTWSDTVHSWFAGFTASPDSIGSKTQFGLLVSCEYF